MKSMLLATLLGAALIGPARAAEPTAPTKDEVKAIVAKGYEALKAKQTEEGSFAPKFGGPGITALAVAGLLRNGYSPDDPVVAKALKYLETKVKPDGGVYDKGLGNYMTCIAIMAFQEANKNGKYDKVIAAAAKYVKGVQHGEDKNSPAFGGAGYDAKSRPDLSNSQFFVEALMAAGTEKNDPSITKAVAFVSRCQNLPGEENDLPFAKKTSEDDKGGFTYNPTEDKDEKSPRKTEAGGLRSEGAMTYAGLKSFLYAGITKEDPRVKAAVAWVKKNYTLEKNPGVGTAGLFYYYQTFAKAMSALGDDVFEDAKGTKHPWKKELFDTLKAKQRADGSWTNDNPALMENSPELCTAYAILALSYCK